MNIKTRNYRFFLLLLLILTIAGGIWYGFRAYEQAKAPDGGMLVRMDGKEQGDDGETGDNLSAGTSALRCA